jgi:hypothetical protein
MDINIDSSNNQLVCLYFFNSWADPNVLFGPYDFAPNTDKLPPECKGGRGKDIGKPKNATVDEHAIYNQQVIVQQQPLQGGGGIGNGNNAQTGNRRTQNANANGGKNTYQYPDYTKDPPCKFFEQCHRNFPNSHTCNTHKYKDGLIYIAHTDGAQGTSVAYSELYDNVYYHNSPKMRIVKVYPSIGGWTLSNSFPVVAADEAKRKRFARECVGLIADYGFDGIVRIIFVHGVLLNSFILCTHSHS